MWTIEITCGGFAPSALVEAARLIEDEFRQNRPWHTNVRVIARDTTLVVEAESDWDTDGLALSDEVSDCICAFVEGGGDGSLAIRILRS